MDGFQEQRKSGEPGTKTVVWTDGSCNANGMHGRGGWAALIEQAGTVSEISGGADGTTHQRMELTAVCEALEMLRGAIEVRTDSPYVEGCFNQNWHERWLRDGAWTGSKGRPVENRVLWERLFGLVWDRTRVVKFVRIKGHAGDPNNDRVDRLARAAALSTPSTRDTAATGAAAHAEDAGRTAAIAGPAAERAPARIARATPAKVAWRDLPATDLAAHLLAIPQICDRAWTSEKRLPRETRAAFIARVLAG
jgi:ribonuclease HI